MPEKLFHFDLDGVRYMAALEDLIFKPIAYCDTPINDFAVPYNTDYVVPFTNTKFDPDTSICEVKLAEVGDLDFYIKPLVEGFYHVDGLFRDTGMTTPTAGVLKIGGGDGLEDVGYCAAPIYLMQGSRIVYCDGVNDTITLEMTHQINPSALFNRLTVPGANGYICIHFCGYPKSATVV